MPVTLGYWKIRGLAAPIRLLLEYVGADYDEKVYVSGSDPKTYNEGWLKEKYKLDLGPFPNLPYYIDGDTRIVESMAIMNHLARKYDLDGKCEDERIRCDILQSRLKDTHWGFVMICYFEWHKKDQYLKDLPGYLAQFQEFLGDNKFIICNEITKMDFLMYEYLSQMLLFEPKCLEDTKFTELRAYMSRFAAIEPIKTYLASDRYHELPVNNPIANWQ